MSALRLNQVFKSATLTLVAVESVHSRKSKTSAGCRLYGNIEPIALVVCSTAETYALDMEAKPVDLDQLRRAIPELNPYVTPSKGRDVGTGDRGDTN